jgi:GNAT superfamily N-acetyltransferase
MDWSIRIGTTADAERISKLITSLAREFLVEEFSEAGRSHFLGEIAPDPMRERLTGDHRFFLAEKETELAGVAAIRGDAHLYYLFVAKAHQRQGLARRLWLVAKDAIRASGHQGVITVNSSTYAIPVYERFGFVRTGPPEEKNGVVHHPMELPG